MMNFPLVSGTPFFSPSATLTSRSARSSTSSALGQRIASGLIPNAFPWNRWLSIVAARRLWADVMASMSPVSRMFTSCIGSSVELPPPAPPPLIPKTGPREGCLMQATASFPFEPLEPHREADYRDDRLAFCREASGSCP